MSGIYLINHISVGIFGMVLSAAFCNILWTRKKLLIMTGSMAFILMFQGIMYWRIDLDIVEYLYPLITHLPLAAVLCILSRSFLWPTFSVPTAYLCCQIRRWLALFIVAVFSGDSAMQDTVELIITLPILLILMWFIAPTVRSISRYTVPVQIQFGIMPTLYYGFDYLTRIYTKLLLEGVQAAVEFMPFVYSVAYLIFVWHTSTEGWIRSQLEQTQDILNLQVEQAVREIRILRESQQKNSVFRHDLRHHMQYLSSCIENGRLGQAQEYIREICLGIEANKVMIFCENEAANLIFSAFFGRTKDCGIPIQIKADIPQNIPIAESDLCVLLSNALENALHACQKRKERGLSAEIEVTTYEKNGKLFFQFINSCDKAIIFNHGIPATHTPGHGMGVRSICAIVERYGGIYAFSSTDEKFILRVSL